MSKTSSIKKDKTVKQKNISDKKYSTSLFLGGILLLTLFLYSNALHGGILNFDDVEYFNNYPELLHLSFKNIQQYFTHYYVIMYQPIPVMTFAMNYHFSGLNTFPMHLVNLCFHLFNILLVFQFVKLITKNKATALIIALLFAIHPMNTEAVSWLSARSSSMYTFFYLFGLIYYIKYVQQNFKMKYIFMSGVFFILSLFTKAQAVTLPVVLLLIDFYFARKLFSKKVLLEKIPFFLLSIYIGIVTLLDKGTLSNLTTGMLIHYSPVDIFFIVCYSISFYFIRFLFPINLCSIYVYPPKDGEHLPIEYYLSALVVLLILIAIFKVRKNRQLIFALGLFFVTIAINIQIIPSRLFEVADRYAYFPYIGLYLVLFFVIQQFKEKKLFLYNKYQTSMIVALLIYVCFFSVSVYSRNNVWQDDVSLLSDIISKNPPVGYISRAYGLRGLAYKGQNKLNEAIQDFDNAVKLKPDESRNYVNRALTYEMMNENQNALDDFNSAEKLDKQQPLIYSYRAQLKFTMNDLKGAEEDCDKCLKLDSANIDAYNTRAFVEYKNKDLVNCEKDLNMAIKYKPDFAIAIKNRGQVYLETGRKELACEDFQKASLLGNGDAQSLYKTNCQ